ncbi:hypothetical protein GCM10011354_02640 [Egicoccus halophilus]|uniref:Uncharacterized protein n=1 Tax=Egicoccus halophilus TaxID=1670830 RepID=A0A8J3A529_9ACTN|nr:hypothetical protein GCM10011354_02640 [Egicoccus halophilus]
MENAAARWKHTPVIARPGDGRTGRPQWNHNPETGSDLHEQLIIHTFHTPYDGHEISLFSHVFHQRCAQLHG